MGRKRKNLEDKSTSICFRLDNKLIFQLCDKFGIIYDKNAEMIEDTVKKQLIAEIKNIIKKYEN